MFQTCHLKENTGVIRISTWLILSENDIICSAQNYYKSRLYVTPELPKSSLYQTFNSLSPDRFEWNFR